MVAILLLRPNQGQWTPRFFPGAVGIGLSDRVCAIGRCRKHLSQIKSGRSDCPKACGARRRSQHVKSRQGIASAFYFILMPPLNPCEKRWLYATVHQLQSSKTSVRTYGTYLGLRQSASSSPAHLRASITAQEPFKSMFNDDVALVGYNLGDVRAAIFQCTRPRLWLGVIVFQSRRRLKTTLHFRNSPDRRIPTHRPHVQWQYPDARACLLWVITHRHSRAPVTEVSLRQRKDLPARHVTCPLPPNSFPCRVCCWLRGHGHNRTHGTVHKTVGNPAPIPGALAN